MRISDWSSDVCSSDLYMLGMIQRQTMRHPRTPVVSTNKKLMMAKALHKRSHVLRHDPFRVSGTVFAGFWARRIAVSSHVRHNHGIFFSQTGSHPLPQDRTRVV